MAKINEFHSAPSVFKKIPLRVSVYAFFTYLLIIGLFIFLINFIKVQDELELRYSGESNNGEVVLCLKNADLEKWNKYQIISFKLVNSKRDEITLMSYTSSKAALQNKCFTFNINREFGPGHYKKLIESDHQFLVVSFSVWNILKFYYGI